MFTASYTYTQTSRKIVKNTIFTHLLCAFSYFNSFFFFSLDVIVVSLMKSHLLCFHHPCTIFIMINYKYKVWYIVMLIVLVPLYGYYR